MAVTRPIAQRRITHGINVVALVGRRIDAEGTATPRFPLHNAPLVQERIRMALTKNRAALLVSSAACGADLLAIEAARQLHLRVHIILPFARDQFRQTSVVDRPGDWGRLFDQLLDASVQEGAVDELDPGLDPHDAYLKVVETILDQAREAARYTETGEPAAVSGEVTAVVVWDAQSRGPRDVTEAFLQQAHALEITVCEVSTLRRNGYE